MVAFVKDIFSGRLIHIWCSNECFWQQGGVHVGLILKNTNVSISMATKEDINK